MLGNIGGIMFGSKGAMTFGRAVRQRPARGVHGDAAGRELGNKGERFGSGRRNWTRSSNVRIRPCRGVWNHWADWVVSAKAGKPAGSGTAIWRA